MADAPWCVRGRTEDEVLLLLLLLMLLMLLVVRVIRRRTLHGRKTRGVATWTCVLGAIDEFDVGSCERCGGEASLSLKAVKDSDASRSLWWAGGMTA